MKLEFGLVGVGRMGGNLSRQALEKGIRVIGYNRSPIAPDLIQSGLEPVDSLKQIRSKLSSPRIIFLYIPAGPIVDKTLEQLSEFLEEGDIVVDGGNSYWGDSIRRADHLKEKKIFLVDLGTSGGVSGARSGACFMAGGEIQAISKLEPILRLLAVEEGFIHAGPSGAGHFVKLVHNGIEFGMLQAIGEGAALLKHYHHPFNIAAILHCWNHGSVIRSWLVELMEDQYQKQKDMEQISSYVEDTGEVNWLITDALNMEVPIPVITQSVIQLLLSRDHQKYSTRAIAMMRHGFGEHPFGADKSIARERKEGRVGDFYHQKNIKAK